MITDNQQYIDMIVNLTSNLGLIGTLIGALVVFVLIMLGAIVVFINSQAKANKKLMEQLPYLLNETKLTNKTLDRTQDKFLSKKEQLEISLDQLYDRLSEQAQSLLILQQDKEKQFLKDREHLYKSVTDLLIIFIQLKQKNQWDSTYDDYIYDIKSIISRFNDKELKIFIKNNQAQDIVFDIYSLLGFKEGDHNE